mgnify:CR=1 FL=1
MQAIEQCLERETDMMYELVQNLLFILIRREDSHFNKAKRSKWEMNRLNYILLKIG